MKRLVFLPIVCGLASCATQAAVPMMWVRADGKSIYSSPAIQTQFRMDSAVCQGQTQQTALVMAPIYYHNLGGAIAANMIEEEREKGLVQVAEGCMAQRGYFHVPVPISTETPKPVASPIAAPAPVQH